MFRLLKSSVTAIALSAFAVAPVVTVLAADAAYAKNGNDNGGGKGGGGNGSDKGNRGNGGTKGNSGAAKTNGGKSASSKSGSGFGLLDIFKQNKAPSTKVAKASAPKAEVKGALHPSNLGKLNGAINSSPNAKLAHIRNGNFSGPVGMASALALADYNYAVDLGAFDLAADTLALADAFALIAGAPTDQEVLDAQALVGNDIDDGKLDIDAQEVLDYPDLTDAKALTENVTEAPTTEDIAAAQAVVDLGEPTLDDVTLAEDDILAAYKGTLDEEAIVDVLAAVRSSAPSTSEIADALPVEEPEDLTLVEDPAVITVEPVSPPEEG